MKFGGPSQVYRGLDRAGVCVCVSGGGGVEVGGGRGMGYHAPRRCWSTFQFTKFAQDSQGPDPYKFALFIIY